MKPIRPVQLFVAALIFTAPVAAARHVPEPVTEPRSAAETPIRTRTHDANRVRLPLTNAGWLGNPIASQYLLWNGDTFLYLGSLWIGARTGGDYPHVSTTVPVEFRPSSGPPGLFHESTEGAAAGGRRGIQGNGDDDRDGSVDEDPLNGIDDDKDARIDEDYAAAGVQMLTAEYRDDVVGSNSHETLGLRIRQRSMAWNGEKTSDFIGIDYEITNVGDQHLREVYFGVDLDVDAGPPAARQYWTDDLAGFARLDAPGIDCAAGGAAGTGLDLVYLWDTPDNGTTIVGGDTPGYVGAAFLGYEASPNVSGPEIGRMTAVRWRSSSSGGYPDGDPRSDFERYELMSSGLIPLRNAAKPDDYRIYASTGPFARLEPGERITISFALVLGNGYDELVANAVAAKRAWDGIPIDGDQDPTTGVEGRETCVPAPEPPAPVYWDDPCDTLHTVIIPTFDPCFWIDADCNPCTGTGGRESSIHWAESLPPPLPASNVDPYFSLTPPGVEIYAVPAAGDARVTLQWDNASELQPDPVSLQNQFEGYRIWRADTYAGRGDQAPPESEWKILAEFRRQPVDGDSTIHCRAPRCGPFNEIEHPERSEVRRLTPFGPYYHIGRYEWNDTLGIVNGKVYYYAVTAFGTTTRLYPGYTEEVEIATTPIFSAQRVIVPRWTAGSGCASVKVVPNPYHGDAEWDLTPSDCDPSGRKIAFRSLPEGWTSLRIFTLAGDLVLSASPEDSRVIGGCETSGTTNPGGTFFWDLIGDGGRQVTSGVYLYVLESPGERCKGRFVIIR